MLSSEQIFDMTCESKQQLIEIMTFLLKYAGKNVNDFYVADDKTLVFCHNYTQMKSKYPFTPSPTVLAEQITEHMNTMRPEYYNSLIGIAPSIDGDVCDGYRIFCPHSEMPEHTIKPYNMNAIFAVRPYWIIYAK